MILFIDDEQKKMSSYVEELMLCNYQVELIGSVNSALNYWNLHQDKINLLILDVMMSAGIFYNNSYSEDGLGTGLCFYHKIRDNNTKIPIVINKNIKRKIHLKA